MAALILPVAACAVFCVQFRFLASTSRQSTCVKTPKFTPAPLPSYSPALAAAPITKHWPNLNVSSCWLKKSPPRARCTHPTSPIPKKPRANWPFFCRPRTAPTLWRRRPAQLHYFKDRRRLRPARTRSPAQGIRFAATRGNTTA